MNINGYTLRAELQNANSGFSKWGFATKNGREFFIKELINPVYPVDRSVMSDEMFMQRRTFCDQYERKFARFFGEINKASRGNLVRIEEFFRYGSRYYLITEKVEGRSFSVDYISSLGENEKLLLLKTVAHCFNDLHSAGIVHADVKPANILIKKTRTGGYAAKLIDFDSGFFKGEVLNNEELGGDLTYLAPETFLAMCGQDVHPDERADIFALGLVFHEYFCGFLPYYDENGYEYPYEAALDGGGLKPSLEFMPDEIGQLIISMIDVDPEKRPSAGEVIEKLNVLTNQVTNSRKIKEIMVRFGGAFGRTICITENSIKYGNTVNAAAQAEMASRSDEYPDNYLTQKSRAIYDSFTYEKIIGEVVKAGLWYLVRVGETDSEESYQTISCVCDDGTVYSYRAEGVANEKFAKIVAVLSSHCDFPQKIGAYSASGTPVSPGYTPRTIAPERPATSTSTSGDWFQSAGDL